MRTLQAVMLVAMLSGCVSAGSEAAVLNRLDPLVTAHAAALGGDDIGLMRSTGRDLIATYDAGRAK